MNRPQMTQQKKKEEIVEAIGKKVPIKNYVFFVDSRIGGLYWNIKCKMRKKKQNSVFGEWNRKWFCFDSCLIRFWNLLINKIAIGHKNPNYNTQSFFFFFIHCYLYNSSCVSPHWIMIRSLCVFSFFFFLLSNFEIRHRNNNNWRKRKWRQLNKPKTKNKKCQIYIFL